MKFELRDSRNGFLWIPNSLFDSFISRIQPSSIVIYLTLARFVNNQTQKCYPSYDLIEKITGFSRPTIASGLQELRSIGAISWEKEGRKNLYRLLDVEPISKEIELVKSTPPTSSNSLPEQLNGLNSNKTYNKTQKQDSAFTLVPDEESGPKTFVRPTLEQVRAYAKEINSPVSPEKWLAYYASNGFRVGKTAMKDWKASFRFWGMNGLSNRTGIPALSPAPYESQSVIRKRELEARKAQGL
jgi:Helix-turn-helix domain